MLWKKRPLLSPNGFWRRKNRLAYTGGGNQSRIRHQGNEKQSKTLFYILIYLYEKFTTFPSLSISFTSFDNCITFPVYFKLEKQQNPSCCTLLLFHRVKFRHDVEIKEFVRSDYEMEDTYLSDDNHETNVLTMGMTCLICVTFTVLLPWYILIGTN